MMHAAQCKSITILLFRFVSMLCKALHLFCRNIDVRGPVVLGLDELRSTALSNTAQSGIANVNLRLK